MFGLGFWEMVIIAVLAAGVIGAVVAIMGAAAIRRDREPR
jgi:hypothetical protein